ncbi:MAG: dimethylsulfonioproprionate lyase family protein [Pseudomonadota bacterium]
MAHDHLYDSLLCQSRDAYSAHPDLAAFAPFPDDIVRCPITPYEALCGNVLRDGLGRVSRFYPDLQAAICAAGSAAIWRETYKGTDIGDQFLTQFGCYAIIGDAAPFFSHNFRLFVVYMPPGLNYPWHHHPAEEIYLVVSGRAVFRTRNRPDELLHEGHTMFHASNEPHAMETLDDPVLCLVAWRNEFETRPVFSSLN